jgi:hypothetical protein
MAYLISINGKLHPEKLTAIALKNEITTNNPFYYDTSSNQWKTANTINDDFMPYDFKYETLIENIRYCDKFTDTKSYMYPLGLLYPLYIQISPILIKK